MLSRLLTMTTAVLIVSASAAFAQTAIKGTYSAIDTGTAGYIPTINDDGGSFLPSPFSENLTLGNTTVASTFLQVAPAAGSSSLGTLKGVITVAFTLTAGPTNSAVTAVTATGNAATLSHGVVTVTADYELFYGSKPQTDCLTWTGTSCTANNNTTTIGDTLAVSFADGALLDINLYNWADWDMQPDISFKLVDGPTAAPEPASLALFATALAVLGCTRRRWRPGT